MKISIISGGFDPLHSGHISYIHEAKKLGDKLIVLLNSDEWLIKKKGKNFLPFKERALILESIKFVDEVIIFEETDPLNLIIKIKPDVLVKGSDYPIDKVIGNDFVNSYGGRVVLVDLIPNQSSTRIINEVKGINRVTYDITSKPPGTIEWE